MYGSTFELPCAVNFSTARRIRFGTRTLSSFEVGLLIDESLDERRGVFGALGFPTPSHSKESIGLGVVDAKVLEDDVIVDSYEVLLRVTSTA